MESLGRYSFIVMIFVILSGVVNMRNEHVCIHSWGAVCSDSWVWGSGQRRRSDGQIKSAGCITPSLITPAFVRGAAAHTGQRPGDSLSIARARGMVVRCVVFVHGVVCVVCRAGLGVRVSYFVCTLLLFH